jgi:hypothetical protein
MHSWDAVKGSAKPNGLPTSSHRDRTVESVRDWNFTAKNKLVHRQGIHKIRRSETRSGIDSPEIFVAMIAL